MVLEVKKLQQGKFIVDKDNCFMGIDITDKSTQTKEFDTINECLDWLRGDQDES